MADGPKDKGNLGRAPTLYAIITFKLLKGVFFVLVALLIYTQSDNDLPTEFQKVLHALRLNPERKFWMDLAVKVDDVTQEKMVHVAIGTLIYGLFGVVEGTGLMLRVRWAGWLSIGESAFFIPIEVYELNQNFTWLVFVILILNIFMVWYLYQNRKRLFRQYQGG